MTDNEIVKALECCNQNDCKTCPYGKYNTAGWCCMPKLRKDTLDLINRQKEEIETKDTIIANQGKIIEELLTNMGKVATEAYREFAKLAKSELFNTEYCLDKYHRRAIDKLLKKLEGGESNES